MLKLQSKQRQTYNFALNREDKVRILIKVFKPLLMLQNNLTILLNKNPNNLAKNSPLRNLIKLEVTLDNLINSNALKDLNIIIINFTNYLIDNAKEESTRGHDKDIIVRLQI